jgi:L-asparaginase/Glu-tRNA(Gln) amidotransferase subunit D
VTVDGRPAIAVFAGPTATILNSAPLVTSNRARARHGLPPSTDAWGKALPFDALRPQRLARPVTLYVEQFSAHPLERDSAHLYADPDGYMDANGNVHPERTSETDVPVYEIELRPEDGLIPLPYMARQRDGSAWESDAVAPGAPAELSRQPFYPDASRLFEEIDAIGVDDKGNAGSLSSKARFDFIRVLPPGGYTAGSAADQRTDVGAGDIPPEVLGVDFFPYRPPHLRQEPPRDRLARVTNAVQAQLTSGSYRGGLWLEGSPFVEETAYWLNLLIDTPWPIVGCASVDWPHGVISASGDRHLVDAVRYVCSNAWCGDDGRDRIGVVVIQAGQVFAAREVQKADARPGGYVATGHHGGVVGAMGESGEPVMTFAPMRLHTHRSRVRVTELPDVVRVPVRESRTGGVRSTELPVREGADLLGSAIPQVSIVKHSRYAGSDGTGLPGPELEVSARIERNLSSAVLSGFVLEGSTPYGAASSATDAALRVAAFSGMPTVRVSRGDSGGFVAHERVRLGIAGANLTATKARLLLMACLLRFGSLPPAVDPANPTAEETKAVERALADYQEVFDSH